MIKVNTNVPCGYGLGETKGQIQWPEILQNGNTPPHLLISTCVVNMIHQFTSSHVETHQICVCIFSSEPDTDVWLSGLTCDWSGGGGCVSVYTRSGSGKGYANTYTHHQHKLTIFPLILF